MEASFWKPRRKQEAIAKRLEAEAQVAYELKYAQISAEVDAIRLWPACKSRYNSYWKHYRWQEARKAKRLEEETRQREAEANQLDAEAIEL
jgi:hypothetical protein